MKEVEKLEPVRVQGVLEVDENGEETAEMLEEEKELEIMESKLVKRKKMDNLVDWGEVDEFGEKPESAEISKLLVAKESVLKGKESSLNKREEQPSKRMKQLEIEFVKCFKKFTRVEPEVIEVVEEDPSTPKGWKAGTLTSSTLVRKKSLKQLRKENTRITNWVKKVVLYEVEENEEVVEKDTEVFREIEEQMEVDDPEVVERRIKRDRKRTAWQLRAIAKEVSNEIINEIVMEIPGRAVAINIFEEILEMIGWRVNLNMAWSILEEDRKLQRMIIWRIENQWFEEEWLAEAMKKEDRLQEVKRKTLMFRNKVVEMDWNTGMKDEVLEMEWMDYEQKEH